MPTLTTFLIGLPVWPFHSPDLTRLAKSAIRPSTSCTCATTSVPSTTRCWLRGHAQRHVQHGAVFGHVDVLAAEHGVPALGHAGLLGQRDQQPHGLVGDPVLGVVQVEPGRLRGQPLAPARVAGEQVAQVLPGDLLVVPLERLP